MKSFIRTLILAVIVGLMLPVTVIQPAQASVSRMPEFQAGPCPFDLPAGVEEGVDVSCGNFQTPERYDEPDGPTISLAVAVIKSTSSNPQADPIFFAQGGPGGSTLDYFTQVLFDSPLRAQRDLVLFDQRGTLYSDPALMCPEFLDENIKILDQELSDEEENTIYREAADACRERLTSEGVNLSAFNSIENAHDVNALRQALGYEKINFYGVSYGTLLGLHLMRLHPEGLRSVVLDAVVPTQVDFNPESARTADRALSELFSACTADAECSRVYPDLETVFFELVDRFDDTPVMLNLTDLDTGEKHEALLDGDGMIQLVFQSLYSSELLPLLPKMIFDVRAGRMTFVERIQSLLTFDRKMAEGMYYSVICAEDADYDLDQVDYSGIRPRLVEGERENNRVFLQVCQDWNVTQLGPSADEPVVSDVPTLVMNGRFDPITPERYGNLAAQSLSNSFAFTFPNTGHGAIGDACADQIMDDFIANPAQKPDSSCIGEETIDYVSSEDVVDFPVLIQALNLETKALVQVGLLILFDLVLLTAWLVFPISWLVRVVRSQAGRPTPFHAHLAPWLAMLIGLLVLLFGIALIVVTVNLVQDNDILILMGVPAQYRWIFVFPLLASLLTLVLVVQVIAGWAGSYWSVRRKVYLSILALSAVACTILFLMTGALGGLVG
jgi:pimeloyl-ACP methyl ester carboxylesterase